METLTVTAWHFVARDGILSRNRQDVDPSFSPDSTVWAGPLITSGTVTVDASVSNVGSRKKSVGITVSPRDWKHEPIPGWPELPQVIGQGWLPTRPSNVHDLGQSIFAFRGDNVADSTNSHVLVNDGPNAFFYYVAKLPPLLDSLHIAINETALLWGSDFWALQPEASASRVYDSENRCYRADVTSQDTRDKILKHEGSRWELEPVSHAGVFKRLTFATVVPAAESVFSKAEEGIQGLRNRWSAVVFPVQLKVYALAGKPVDHENSVYFGIAARNNIGCHFTYSH